MDNTENGGTRTRTCDMYMFSMIFFERFSINFQVINMLNAAQENSPVTVVHALDRVVVS